MVGELITAELTLVMAAEMGAIQAHMAQVLARGDIPGMAGVLAAGGIPVGMALVAVVALVLTMATLAVAEPVVALASWVKGQMGLGALTQASTTVQAAVAALEGLRVEINIPVQMAVFTAVALVIFSRGSPTALPELEQSA